MNQSAETKKELLFDELYNTLDKLRGYADMDSLLMPLFYVLCARHEGHLFSPLSDGPNIFEGERHLPPLLDSQYNDARSDLLKRIYSSVDSRYFHGKTVQVIYDFYLRNSELIDEYYPELVEFILAMYSKSAGKYSGMFATPNEISRVMYHLALQGGIESIYDPCAGLCSGILLPEARGIDYVGQEINDHIKLFADIRLDAHRREASLYCEDSLKIWRGNEAECLCADFPIGLNVQTYDEDSPKLQKFEDVILWKFINTPTLKRAVVLTSNRFCWDKANMPLRKTLCEKNFIDTVIELPAGVLSYTGITTAIVVLNKERTTKNVRFVSATDCFIQGRKEKTLDVEQLMTRLKSYEGEQFRICEVKEMYKHDCVLTPSAYIAQQIKLQAGQKLVKFSDLIISEIRNNQYDDVEGFILPDKHMCSTITEFYTGEHGYMGNLKLKSLEGRRYNKLTHPCIIFNVRADKFFIKTDGMPLFVSANYHAFDVDTSKCIPEYLVLALLKSKDMVRAVTRGAGVPRIEYRNLRLPIYEDLKIQRQIVDREFRQEEKQLRNKLAYLQMLSGRSSDLIHNLGVTFTRLDAAVENLRQETEMEQELSRKMMTLVDAQSPLARTIKVLDDNIKYALRLINSTGTDFSKSVPAKKKVVLQEVIEEYLESWKTFGYATFSILPLKSAIPQTKVEIDPDMLYTALDCILINAHQHGFLKQGKDTNHVLIELKAVTIKDEKYALISVSNNGEPLPDGFTLQDFAARGIVGLNSSQDGLGGYHIASIAHLHDGFIAIEKSTEWLSFHILIPTYINAKETVFDEYECEYL